MVPTAAAVMAVGHAGGARAHNRSLGVVAGV